MLVLSRKNGESFVIGKDIKVTILEFGRGKVRVGIDAPTDVDVVRTELLEVNRGQANDGHTG